MYRHSNVKFPRSRLPARAAHRYGSRYRFRSKRSMYYRPLLCVLGVLAVRSVPYGSSTLSLVINLILIEVSS
jgi:hypothetical protein